MILEVDMLLYPPTKFFGRYLEVYLSPLLVKMLHFERFRSAMCEVVIYTTGKSLN